MIDHDLLVLDGGTIQRSRRSGTWLRWGSDHLLQVATAFSVPLETQV